MDDRQSEEVISLLHDLKKLMEDSIVLNEQIVRMFQKYDAEVFEEEEIKRELQRNSGDSEGKNKSILGNTGRS